jgi:PAS domain S-box-containing protein
VGANVALFFVGNRQGQLMPEVDWRFMFDNVDHAIIVHDPGGAVQAWNLAAAASFGHDEYDACGKHILDLIAPEEDMARYRADLAAWRQSKNGYVTVRDKTGRPFSVLLRCMEHGGLFYLTFLENGLSTEMDAGCLLRVLDKAGHLIFVKDRDGRYVDFNECFKRTFCLCRDDLLNKSDHDFFSENEARRFRENDLVAWSSSALVTVVEQATIRGRKRTFSVTKVVEDLPLRERRLVCVANDVTDLIESQADVTRLEKERLLEREQAALQMSKTKTDFIATMSHEIRTPINAMIGFTTLLRETNLSAEQREYTEAVHRSCGVLLSLINDILDFSKIEGGKVVPESSPVDVNALVAELLRDCCNPKRITLRSDVIPSAGFYICTDGARLRQILAVFLSNALKFTFSGGITITATHDDERVDFHVIDTGIGIAEDALDTLFRPFTQADASTTRRFGGTGMGLSISRSLANLLGGDVDVVSQPHRGSDFHLWIPHVESKPQEGAHYAGLCGSEGPDVAGPRVTDAGDPGKHFILVVEDNPMNGKLMTRMLEKLGYRAVVATNGLEALNMLRLDPYKYSLTLMDCSMPVMDGYEATKEIRKLPAPPGCLPIIALTANVLSGERQRVLDVGMNEYMSKPVFKEALEGVIERWLPIGASLIKRI